MMFLPLPSTESDRHGNAGVLHFVCNRGTVLLFVCRKKAGILRKGNLHIGFLFSFSEDTDDYTSFML